MDSTPSGANAGDLHELIGQIDQLQSAVTEQQRALLMAREPQVKRVALHGTSDLVSQLLALRAAADQLDRRLKRQQKEEHQLRALQSASATINSSLDTDVVLEQLMDAIIQLTRAERAMLLLDDVQAGILVKMARNFDQVTLDQAASADISKTIVRQVIATGEPVMALDAQADERFAAQDSIASHRLRSILCVPLRMRGVIAGALYADSRASSGIFSDIERDTLAAFADQAAVALDNARLFEEIAGMKNLMDNVFASIDSGVITIDAADCVAFVNRAAEVLLGKLSADVLGQPYETVLMPMREVLTPLVTQVRQDGLTRSVELDADNLTGETARVLSITLSPLQSRQAEELGGVAIVMEDVSEKKRVESLRRYLPPAFVDRVRDLDAAQRPQRREITILFADIRSFSTIGEHLEPEELIHLANGFFSEAVAAITEQQGLIDKFVGDAVMALFNTPLNPQEDHAAQAVRAAMRIRDNVLRFRRSLPSDVQLRFGIGIHTGEVVVGNVGSQQRKDYSAIGDVVNLAKRLQEMAGFDEILVSRSVHDAVDGMVSGESLPPVQVKGRQTWEEVFRLTGWQT